MLEISGRALKFAAMTGTTAALKLSVRRVFAALLFAVVALHATLPVGTPLEQSAGSAFSASSVDVALNCAARIAGERKALPDQSGPTPSPCVIRSEPLAGAVPEGTPARIYDAQAPPAFLALFPQSSPRAPPAA